MSQDLEGDRATDAELVELFDMDDADELFSTAKIDGDRISHQTCDGQWIKRHSDADWQFERFAE